MWSACSRNWRQPWLLMRRWLRPLPPVRNRPDIFGEQLMMDAGDEIVGRRDILLTTASSISVEEVLPLARSFGGTAFPAHIDRESYSVLSALGDIPAVGFRAVEITARGDLPALLARYPETREKPLLLNSDAHYLHQLGDPAAWLELPERSAAAHGGGAGRTASLRMGPIRV